jgi:hypothetical protein
MLWDRRYVINSLCVCVCSRAYACVRTSIPAYKRSCMHALLGVDGKAAGA